MAPSSTAPCAQHALFGYQCFDVSIGSEYMRRDDSIPMDTSFFHVLQGVAAVRNSVGEFSFRAWH